MRQFEGKVIITQIILSVIGIIIAFFACTATAQALLQVGAQAPDFSLKDIEGKDVSLARHSRDKGIAILFWSTWSANSLKALKRFEAFYRKYRDRGVEVIGINADNQELTEEDLGRIRKLVKEFEISFPVAADNGLKTFHEYSIIALPSVIVVSEGKIVYELAGFPLVGAEDLFDYLSVLSGEPPRKKFEPKYKPRHEAIAETGLARGFVKKKRYEKAYPLFFKAIEIDPKYMLPYVELARLYETEGRKAEAEDVLKKALSVEPENIVVISELGFLLAKSGKTKEAADMLEKAAKADSYTPTHYYFAYAKGMSGQFGESLKAFEYAISLNPYDPSIYMLRAEVYEKNGMSKEAASDYRKALEIILNRTRR